MTIFVKQAQVVGVGPFSFIAPASSIGLKTGEWPCNIETEIGNKLPLVRGKEKISEGKIVAVHYRQKRGCLRVEITND